MLGSKSDEKSPRFDEFSCIRCGTTITLAPLTGPKSNQ